jgi:hypothetical protein
MRAVTTYVNRTPNSSYQVVLGFTLTAASLWCCALVIVYGSSAALCLLYINHQIDTDT